MLEHCIIIAILYQVIVCVLCVIVILSSAFSSDSALLQKTGQTNKHRMYFIQQGMDRFENKEHITLRAWTSYLLMLQVAPNAEKLMWTLQASALIEGAGNSELLDLAVPPEMEGMPKRIDVSVLLRQNSKVSLSAGRPWQT